MTYGPLEVTLALAPSPGYKELSLVAYWYVGQGVEEVGGGCKRKNAMRYCKPKENTRPSGFSYFWG